MTSQHLQRDNRRILHKIVENLPMEHLHRAIITRIRKQREPALMEAHGANGLCVVAQRLVGGSSEVEVVPQQAAIVRAEQHVLAGRVDVDAGQPAGAGQTRAPRCVTTTKCGLVGWNAALCAAPFSRRNGCCVWCLLTVWIATAADRPRGDTVAT